MVSAVLDAVLQEYRTRRMARFAFWVLAYGLALWLVDRFAGGVSGVLWFLFWITFLPTAVYYLIRLVRLFKQRVLWRLRRRLIVTYVFIAVVPVLLIVLLVTLGVYITNGNFAAYLVTMKLREHVAELQQLSRGVALQEYGADMASRETVATRLQDLLLKELQRHAAAYPALEITLRVGPETRAFYLDGKPVPKPVSVPPWLGQGEFAGMVVDQGQLAYRAVQRGRTAPGDSTLILSQPFTPELLDVIGRGIGPVGVVTTQKISGGVLPPEAEAGGRWRFKTSEGEYVETGRVRSKSLEVPEAASRLDFTVFGGSTLDPVLWGGEREQLVPEPVFVYVTSRIWALNQQLFVTLGQFSRFYVTLFVLVAAFFLVIELFALVVGNRLTRSMTNTVDKLEDATERVKAGDFSYRINLPARDQLTALGEAFDGMTASVERLLRESQEKLRLESELEIAREVQKQLFPQVVPKVPGLELYAVCKPARVVSGDYYDFLHMEENRVGLVLSDVSGKGISAALLMAAIQSSLRAQFANSRPREGIDAAQPISTAEAVQRLNRQLFESTPTEKYATFFCAIYDGAWRTLTYTNAGHLPPVLFRRGATQRLDVGGTVVGLFSSVEYEQAVVQLQPGDLLLAFSDGLTEPENIYGEEFGEARLLEVARRALIYPPDVLIEEIYRSVADWTGSPELQDDMTLLVAKATE